MAVKSYKTELINGKYYTKKEAAKLSKVSYQTYVGKLRKGFNAQEIYEIGPIRGGKTELINGKYYTKKEAAKLSKVSHQVYLKMSKDMSSQQIYDTIEIKKKKYKN